MEDVIYLAVYWIIEGAPIIFQNGWGPIAVENMDSCLQRAEDILQYITDTGLMQMAGAEEVHVHCGTVPDHLDWLDENYPE